MALSLQAIKQNIIPDLVINNANRGPNLQDFLVNPDYLQDYMVINRGQEQEIKENGNNNNWNQLRQGQGLVNQRRNGNQPNLESRVGLEDLRFEDDLGNPFTIYNFYLDRQKRPLFRNYNLILPKEQPPADYKIQLSQPNRHQKNQWYRVLDDFKFFYIGDPFHRDHRDFVRILWRVQNIQTKKKTYTFYLDARTLEPLTPEEKDSLDQWDQDHPVDDGGEAPDDDEDDGNQGRPRRRGRRNNFQQWRLEARVIALNNRMQEIKQVLGNAEQVLNQMVNQPNPDPTVDQDRLSQLIMAMGLERKEIDRLNALVGRAINSPNPEANEELQPPRVRHRSDGKQSDSKNQGRLRRNNNAVQPENKRAETKTYRPNQVEQPPLNELNFDASIEIANGNNVEYKRRDDGTVIMEITNRLNGVVQQKIPELIEAEDMEALNLDQNAMLQAGYRKTLKDGVAAYRRLQESYLIKDNKLWFRYYDPATVRYRLRPADSIIPAEAIPENVLSRAELEQVGYVYDESTGNYEFNEITNQIAQQLANQLDRNNIVAPNSQEEPNIGNNPISLGVATYPKQYFLDAQNELKTRDAENNIIAAPKDISGNEIENSNLSDLKMQLAGYEKNLNFLNRETKWLKLKIDSYLIDEKGQLMAKEGKRNFSPPDVILASKIAANQISIDQMNNAGYYFTRTNDGVDYWQKVPSTINNTVPLGNASYNNSFNVSDDDNLLFDDNDFGS